MFKYPSDSDEDESAPEGEIAYDSPSSDEELGTASQRDKATEHIEVVMTNNQPDKRAWDKIHSCYLCKTMHTKIRRHLLNTHKNDFEIVKISSLQPAAKELAIIRLINLGDHVHNVETVRRKSGKFLVSYRPMEKGKNYADYLPCSQCFSYLNRIDLYRHKCKLSNAKPSLSKSRLAMTTAYHNTKELQHVLNSMRKDEIGLVALNDKMILSFAEHLVKKHYHNKELHSFIRTKMREMARLLITVRKISPTTTNLKKCLVAQMFPVLIKAVNKVSGLDDNARKVIPSLALKLGHSLQKCAEILRGQEIIKGSGNETIQANFIELCQKQWAAEVSSKALRIITNKKLNTETLPLTEDLLKFNKYLMEKIQFYHNRQERSENLGICHESYICLNELVLSYVTIFNRRRQGETSRLKIKDYHSSDYANSTGTEGLSKLETSLCRSMKRIQVIGKRGRAVPVIFTEYILKVIDQQLATRKNLGEEFQSEYLFPKPSNVNDHLRASDVIRKFADKCGAKKPELLRSTQFRKHLATNMQLLNLPENEMDSVCAFFGHDIKVHRNFYRLPDSAVQLGKVSKLLLAMEKGDVEEMKGKNLNTLLEADGMWIMILCI